MQKPLLKQYKKGAVIFFQGDKPDNRIFALRSGTLLSYFTALDSGREEKEYIQTGEFFGVKSVLGRYPREVSVKVMSDATVLVFNEAQFQMLTMKNVQLILKMLKVFSSELRRNGKKVKNLLSSNIDGFDPESGLYSIGEFYMKNRKTDQAKYAFERYLQYYPNGVKTAEAKARLKNLGGGTSAAASAAAPAADPKKTPPSQDQSDIMRTYFNGNSMLKSGQYEDAIPLFKQIVASVNVTPAEVDLQRKALFDLGRAYLQTDKAQEALKVFTSYIKKYPKDSMEKNALLCIGDSTYKLGDQEKAAQIYQRIVNTPPREKTNETAQSRLQTIKG